MCLFTSSTTHLIVDVNGFVPGSVSSLVSVVPARLLETRSGPGMTTVDHQFEGEGTVAAGSVKEVPVLGRGQVAGDAATTVLNVTVTEPQAAGFITVFPCGESPPLASNLNYLSGATVANAVVTRVGAGGKICIFTSATTHLIVDVNAFLPAAVTSVVSVVPARLLDTRSGPGISTVDHVSEGGGMVPGGTIAVLPIVGRGGVAANAGSVMLNVTVTGPVAPGFITVFPCDEPRPTASNVNHLAGSTVANAVVTKVGVSGDVCLFTLATTHLVVDVNGYAL